MNNPKDIFEILKEARKAGDSDEQLYKKINSFLEQRARETGTPFRGDFELTPLCNLDCKMCYVHLNEAQLKGRKLLPSDVWIDLMGQAIDAGMTRATLTGGECLTYPEFDKLYLFLKNKGIMVTVKTNGVLLDADRIEFFKQYSPRGVHVTLYGHTDELYEKVTGKRAFSRVIENVQRAKKEGLPISVMITPNQYMGEAVKDTIRFAKGLEVPYFINSLLVTPRQDTKRKKEKYDLTIDQIIDVFSYDAALNGRIPKECKSVKREETVESHYKLSGIRCGAGKSSFSIGWDGKMHPCLSMDSISDDPRTIGFSSAWEHVNHAMNSFPAFVKCESCVYSQVCSFCAAENEKLGSRYLLNDLWCQHTWRIVESGMVAINQECAEG